jgi:hypothetical protein
LQFSSSSIDETSAAINSVGNVRPEIEELIRKQSGIHQESDLPQEDKKIILNCISQIHSDPFVVIEAHLISKDFIWMNIFIFIFSQDK